MNHWIAFAAACWLVAAHRREMFAPRTTHLMQRARDWDIPIRGPTSTTPARHGWRGAQAVGSDDHREPLSRTASHRRGTLSVGETAILQHGVDLGRAAAPCGVHFGQVLGVSADKTMRRNRSPFARVSPPFSSNH